MQFTPIHIIGINKDGIEKDHSFETAYKYPLLLSSRPDDLWVKFFHGTFRTHSFEKKRQYTIMDRSIVVIISGDDIRQQQVNFFKELTALANKKYEELLISKEEERKKEEARKRRELEKIQELKQESENLDLS